jgi:hypothetical protein
LVVALALALVGGALLTVWLLRDALVILAAVVVGGLVLIGMIAAAALPIRAWRKNDAAPIEKQVIREVRVIERPQLPAAVALPAPAQPAYGVFPELLRASYRAGLLAGPGDVVNAEVRQLPAGDGWDGDITG